MDGLLPSSPEDRPHLQQEAAASGPNDTIYCPHCGTKNALSLYSCLRCGERLFLPNPDAPPPMGLAACPKCEKANVGRASYCVFCGVSMEAAVRMTPAGTAATRNTARAREQRERVSQRDQRRDESRPGERRQDERRTAQPDLRRSETRTEPLRPAPVPNARAEANDSGTPGGQLPAQLRGFNWAAFLLGMIWGLGNGVLLALLVNVAGYAALWFSTRGTDSVKWMGFAAWVVANLVVGYKGNEWAWRARKWQSAEHFKRVQQGWLLWAVVGSVIVMIAFSLFFRADS